MLTRNNNLRLFILPFLVLQQTQRAALSFQIHQSQTTLYRHRISTQSQAAAVPVPAATAAAATTTTTITMSNRNQNTSLRLASTSTSTSTSLTFIEGVESIADSYDTFLLDMWYVLRCALQVTISYIHCIVGCLLLIANGLLLMANW